VRWAAAPTAPVASVVGQTGIITGAQIAADAALTGTYAAKQINDPRGILHAALSNVDAERVAIVMAGSSTTAGTGASAPQLSYVQRVLRGMEGTYPRSTNIPGPGSAFLSVEVSFPATTAGVYVCNAGVASTTSANYLTATTRGQIAAMNPQPRVIIHTIGSNDYAAGMDPATYGANVAVQLADLKTRITGPCVHVLVHSWQRRDVTSPAYPWASYGAQLAAIAAVDPDHVVFVDASDAFARAGIASGDPFDLLEPTGVHGNDAGHALLADVVLDRLLIRGTPPPPVWLRSRFTSDTFTGTGEIVGATTNIGIGGAAKTWGGMATYMAMGAGALTIAQAGSWTVGVPMLYPDYELTCKIIAMPVGAAANIELRRQALDVASTPDTIRLVINTDGSQVIYKRVSGALTSLRYCSSPLVGVGDIITLGVKGTAVWLKVNGYVSASVVVPEITAAGNAAFSSGGATAFSVDNFAVDVLT
jgi:lysophospholipase L1-like esterase